MRKATSGIDMLGVLAIGFVVASVIISLGANVIAQVSAGVGNETQGYNTPAFLAANNGSMALNNISSNLPLLGTIGVLVIVVIFITLLRGRGD